MVMQDVMKAGNQGSCHAFKHALATGTTSQSQLMPVKVLKLLCYSVVVLG
jgi:hypothetical protein